MPVGGGASSVILDGSSNSGKLLLSLGSGAGAFVVIETAQ